MRPGGRGGDWLRLRHFMMNWRRRIGEPLLRVLAGSLTGRGPGVLRLSLS